MRTEKECYMPDDASTIKKGKILDRTREMEKTWGRGILTYGETRSLKRKAKRTKCIPITITPKREENRQMN